MRDTKFLSGLCRFSYVTLDQPRAVAGDPSGKKNYGLVALIAKSDTATKANLDRIVENAILNGIEKIKEWKGDRPDELANPIGDGDSKKYKDKPEYHGHWVVNLKSPEKNKNGELNPKPGVKKQVDGKAVDADPSELYSGCYGRVSGNAYPYWFLGKFGVSIGLNGAQFLKHGERLAGGGDGTDDFNGTPMADFGEDSANNDFL